ncbi:TonB family protein [Vibrio sp. TRT 21S02]|uniref:energy transducer TonB n=1 Tax=unclassified Vibrio TaxID=2614977 RepID=UPI00349FB286
MNRLILALPTAAIITLGLFVFMSWMVDNGHRRTPEASQPLSFNMVMVENEQDVQRRKRALPEQPEIPEVPEQKPVEQMEAKVSQVSPTSSIPTLGLNTAISGIAINAPTFGDFGVNQEVVPLYRVEPAYPAKAKARGVEGFVTLSFTIDETGRPVDVEVVDAKPRRFFERDAIRALRRWKYQPQIEEGKAVARQGQTVTLEFKLVK